MPAKHYNSHVDSKQGGGVLQGGGKSRPYFTTARVFISCIVGAGLIPALLTPILQGRPIPACSRNIHLCLLLCLLIFPLASCDTLPSVTISITPASTSSNGTQLNVWNRVATGVEIRNEDWKIPGGDDDTVTIVRFDVHKIKLSVGYQPGQPLSMNDWMQQAHPLAIINGGYFDQQFNATALVVSNGKIFGESYSGFGGMLSVNAHGTVSERSLRQQPYAPNNEQLEQATQSAPMLILGGKRTQFSADASQTRRSVVAMDKQGHLLFIVSPNPVFSLDELADQLASSDLSIAVALNLDGGSSTGLYVNGGSSHVAIDSLAKLPIVIIIKTR
jgi:uncharacterized protein YigE (DUF2233 family)